VSIRHFFDNQETQTIIRTVTKVRYQPKTSSPC